MQLKKSNSKSSAINSVSHDQSLPEDSPKKPTIFDAWVSDHLTFDRPKPATEDSTETLAPPRNRRGNKLSLFISLPLGFYLGLGAIIFFSLPSLLSCANIAKQSEGRNGIGSINRGQQAFYLEKNKFTNSIPELGLGMSTQTVNYQYFVQTESQFVVNYAQSKKPDIKSYMGIVFVPGMTQANSSTPAKATQTITCEVNQPQPLANIMPVYQNGTVSCPQGTKQIS